APREARKIAPVLPPPRHLERNRREYRRMPRGQIAGDVTGQIAWGQTSHLSDSAMRYCRNADHVLVYSRLESHGEIPRSLRLRPVRQRKPAVAGLVPDVRRGRFAAARGRRGPHQTRTTLAGREQRGAAAAVAGRRARRPARAYGNGGARSGAR